jgi:ubiquitin-protein ligase E3 C
MLGVRRWVGMIVLGVLWVGSCLVFCLFLLGINWLVDALDPSHASSWPPLLFLADLYSQSLLTMGDDEFFSSTTSHSSTTSSPPPPQNPLTLDELTAFSRKLLNIAFTLYWREDQTNVLEGLVPGGLRLKWEGVREKVTRCLLGIHARE